MSESVLKKTKYKILRLITVGLVLQLQFGCSLIKSGTSNSPGGNSGTANSAAANSASGANQTVGGGSSDDAAAKSNISTICRNAHYPVSPNVERKYHVTYQKMANLNQDSTEKFSNFTTDGFTANNIFKESNSNINWRCLPDGLLSTQYSNTIDYKQGGAKIDTVSSNGISFPIESRWKPGEKWTTDYQIKESPQNTGGPSGGIEATGAVKQNWEIVGAEEVAVPAGAFQAMKVKMNLTLDLNISVMGRTIPAKTNVDSTTWFTRDVGIVKTTATVGSLDTATSELISYSGTK